MLNSFDKKKEKSVSLEEIYDFCDEHINQKTDNEFELIDSLTSVESYQMGLFEGVINGLVWAGYDIKDLDQLSNPNYRKSNSKVKKFA